MLFFTVECEKNTDERILYHKNFFRDIIQTIGGAKMKFKLNIDRNKEERVEATLHGKGDFSYRLEELVLGYSGEDSVMAYTEDDIKELKYRDIECVTVIDSKTYAIDTAGDRYRLKMRLYEISEILPSYFIKINKSSLANRKQIERFSAAFSGSVDVIFKCGYKDYVSRRCFADIKKPTNKKSSPKIELDEKYCRQIVGRKATVSDTTNKPSENGGFGR